MFDELSKRIARSRVQRWNAHCSDTIRMEGMELPDWAYLESLHPYGDPCVYQDSDLQWLSHQELELSLICPLYNSERYLDGLLRALTAQTNQHLYEIILVDDGSKDNTLQLAQVWQQRYPALIRVIPQNNRGISEARNTGINHSVGQYLGFIDHDDVVESDYVERLLDAAQRENADIVKCAYDEREDGIVVSRSAAETMVVTGPMTEELFTAVGYVWGGIYRRSLFANLRFPVGYWYEDMIRRSLLYRQSRQYVQLSECLYHKTKSQDNASVKVWSDRSYKCLEHLYLIKEIISVNNRMNLGQDIWFYRSMLKECMGGLHGRIQGLPRNDRKQIFDCMTGLMSGIWSQSYLDMLTERERLWNRAILQREFAIWELLSKI